MFFRDYRRRGVCSGTVKAHEITEDDVVEVIEDRPRWYSVLIPEIGTNVEFKVSVRDNGGKPLVGDFICLQ